MPALRSGRARARAHRARRHAARGPPDRRAQNDAIEAGTARRLRRRGPRARLSRRRVRRGCPRRRRWFSLHRRVAEHESASAGGRRRPDQFQVDGRGLPEGDHRLERDEGAPDAVRRPLPARDRSSAGRAGACRRRGPGSGSSSPERATTAAASRATTPSCGIRSRSSPRLARTPATLPRLRVGHHYRLRARTVDLAGNSRPFPTRSSSQHEPTLRSEAQRIPPLRAGAVADGAAPAPRHRGRVARAPRRSARTSTMTRRRTTPTRPDVVAGA